MGCKYCNGTEASRKYLDEDKDSWLHDHNGKWFLNIEADFTDMGEKLIAINYCPMCGRKLTEGNKDG